MKRMTDEQVQERLATSPDWSDAGETIQRTFQFKDFVQAMRFVNRVADAAEAMQHHPDILVRWNKVTLTLSTHDAGGITTLDFDLADQCDTLAAQIV